MRSAAIMLGILLLCSSQAHGQFPGDIFWHTVLMKPVMRAQPAEQDVQPRAVNYQSEEPIAEVTSTAINNSTGNVAETAEASDLHKEFGLDLSDGLGEHGPVAVGSLGLAAAPYMIGDFFGGQTNNSTNPNPEIRAQEKDIFIPSPGTGAIGRMKIAENTSPLPRDRVFFNYSFFENVPLVVGGTNVQRFTPGIEKTFFDRRASIEFKTPMALTLGSDQDLAFPAVVDHFEFGNVQATLKFVLSESTNSAFTGGFAVNVPTADDSRQLKNGTATIVKNEAVHLMPYFGGIYAPDNGFFVQGFVQVDLDLNGNPVYLAGNERGIYQDQTLLFLDLGMGYWMYQEEVGWYGITGIAPTVELHYNRTLQDADVIAGIDVGSSANSIELLTGVVGGTFTIGPLSWLTFGYAFPLGGGRDQQFDGEARAMFNRFF